MIEFSKLMIAMNDTAKNYVKDGNPLITEEKFIEEFQRRDKTCFYHFKWELLWKEYCLSYWWKHSVLKRPFNDERQSTNEVGK